MSRLELVPTSVGVASEAAVASREKSGLSKLLLPPRFPTSRFHRVAVGRPFYGPAHGYAMKAGRGEAWRLE